MQAASPKTGEMTQSACQIRKDKLSSVPSHIRRGGYDRSSIRVGLAHIGVGGFHRAHLAVLLDRCLSIPGNSDWGICGMNILKQDEAMAKAMKLQDGLYTVTEMQPNGDHTTRLIEAMVEYVFVPEDVDFALNRLADPHIKIVSLTITEGGYFLDKQGRFDVQHPDIVNDLKNPRQPKTAFGILVEAIRRRRDAGVRPFTVLSCDNLLHNGDTTKMACVEFAKGVDRSLADLIAREVAFPNSMVDRITPRTDPATKEMLWKLTGVQDEAPVICEDFIQWVVEDNFPSGRPSWERVGVFFTPDVYSYEQTKMRLLNASHCLLAYPAYLAGFRKVDEAITDPLFNHYIRSFMFEDAAPWLKSLPDLDMEDYIENLMKRFSNRFIGDQVSRICGDGGSKFPKFVVPTLNHCIKNDRSCDRLAFFIASYERYLDGADEKHESYSIQEPGVPALLKYKSESKSPRQLLDFIEVFGTVARQNQKFVDCYLNYVEQIRSIGIRATLRGILDSDRKNATVLAR